MKTKKKYQDMTADELALATKEFDEPWQGRRLPGRALTAKERNRFEAWQKKAQAEEAAALHDAGKQSQGLTVLFPSNMASRIGDLARQKHIAPATLVKRIVQDAIQAVA